MNLKESLIAAAAAGFALGLAAQNSSALAEESAAPQSESVKSDAPGPQVSPGSAAVPHVISAAATPAPKNDQCFGINSCKGKNSCGVSKEQIKVANEKFKNKYTKSKSLECSGTASASAKKGVLAWVQKNNADECLKAGGFVFEKDSAGKLMIRTSKS